MCYIITNIFVLLLIVLLAMWTGSQNSGLVGLSIFANSVSQFVMHFGSTENEFNCVERLGHYVNDLPTEAPSQCPNDPEESKWPNGGSITFEDVQLGYHGTTILNNLSLEIRGGEKIGICGRTGSGKVQLFP